MGKFVDDSIRDNGLVTMNTSVRMSLCKQAPINYADIAVQQLGFVIMTPSDYTLAAGEIDGRRSVVTTKNITPFANDAGADLHVVHDDGSKIMAYTDIVSQKGIVVNQVEPIPSHDVIIRASIQ